MIVKECARYFEYKNVKFFLICYTEMVSKPSLKKNLKKGILGSKRIHFLAPEWKLSTTYGFP